MIRKVLTLTTNSTNDSFWDLIRTMSPCFPVDAISIEVLSDPSDFYSRLLENCRKARKRITLASLYIGTGKLECELVNAIQSNLLSNGQLCVNVLLDFNRGSRNVDNSRQILLPLLQSSKLYNNDRCKISLYHTPNLNGWCKKLVPSRWNEIFGLQHMKLYIFDNELIISGANLSHDYFTNRQDRYYVIHDKNIADFFDNLVKCVQQLSFTLQSDDSVSFDGNRFLKTVSFNNKSEIDTFRNAALQLVREFWDESLRKYRYSGSTDTWIYPLVEMSQLNFKNDSIILEKFLKDYKSQNSQLIVSTGYFNITKKLKNILLEFNSSKCCRILLAHPIANSYYNSKGLSNGIPNLYSLFAYKFQKDVHKQKCEKRITLWEYQRPNWTFHAKGLWSFPKDEQSPTITIIGSSNFNERSYKRDLEAQLFIMTKNSNLKNRMRSECEKLLDFVSPLDRSRTFTFWIYVAERFLRSFF